MQYIPRVWLPLMSCWSTEPYLVFSHVRSLHLPGLLEVSSCLLDFGEPC